MLRTPYYSVPALCRCGLSFLFLPLSLSVLLGQEPTVSAFDDICPSSLWSLHLWHLPHSHAFQINATRPGPICGLLQRACEVGSRRGEFEGGNAISSSVSEFEFSNTPPLTTPLPLCFGEKTAASCAPGRMAFRALPRRGLRTPWTFLANLPMSLPPCPKTLPSLPTGRQEDTRRRVRSLYLDKRVCGERVRGKRGL